MANACHSMPTLFTPKSSCGFHFEHQLFGIEHDFLRAANLRWPMSVLRRRGHVNRKFEWIFARQTEFIFPLEFDLLRFVDTRARVEMVAPLGSAG